MILSPGENTIAGKRCYLVEDFISPELPPAQHLVARINDSCVFCSTAELRRIKQITKLPVYGIWQTIIASQLLPSPETGKRYFLPYAADRKRGQILKLTAGKLNSENTDFYGVDHKDADEISIDLTRLHLPSEDIMTPRERVRHRRTKRHAQIAVAAGLLVATAMGYLVTEAWVGTQVTKRETDIAALEHSVEQLRDLLEQRGNHAGITSHYDHTARVIAEMAWRGTAMRVPLMIFDSPPWQTIFQGRKIPLPLRDRVVHTDYLITGATRIEWQ